MRSRPTTVSAAAILLALISVLNFLFALLPIEGIPAIAPYLAVVEGAAGLVGAIGLWRLTKWGLWLTIIVSVLNMLDAAGGVVGAPNTALQVAAAITFLGFVFILVLVVLPSSRRAFRGHRSLR
jgi:hypothetical protein